MNSIFQYAMQNPDEESEEISSIFSEIKPAKKENIIPPIGIAKPELVESFEKNFDNEEEILKDIAEAERYEKENLAESSVREISAHAARGAEGFFGGIGSFINTVIPELEIENEEGNIERIAPYKLPNSNDLHEFTKEKTGKYLEPKNEFTKFTQETSSDIGSMFSSPDKASALSKIALAVGGNIIKQGVKSGGGGEKAQDLSKLGFMTLASMANLGNAQKAASQALGEAERMIPRGLSFNSQPTERALNKVKNSQWYKSGSTPSKNAAIAEIQRVENQISNGRLNGHMAMQLRRDINEARKQLGGFQLNSPVDKKQALRYLDEVDNALMESMESYGKNVNPQWLKQYKLGNEAYRITQRSRMISDVIEKFAKPLQSQTAKTLFHIGGGAALTQVPSIGAAAIPGIATAKTIQIMNRMIKSPVLRNHYLEVLAASSTGNAAVIQKSLEKFDAIAKKLEEKSNGTKVKIHLRETQKENQ